jgi:hypothetical protein
VHYRRDYQRFVLNDSVSLITDEGREKRFLLKDLSARGAGIIGNFSLNLNESVKAIINAPLFFDRPISKAAKVVWCQKIDGDLWQGGLDFGLEEKIAIL